MPARNPPALPSRVRPEALLPAFNRTLLRLNASAPVAEGEETHLLARVLLQQTVTAELISNSYLIAVAGLQGAGKTTLVRQLYDLAPGWLPEDIGIGERMPVMIVESTSTPSPRGLAVELDPDDGSTLRTVELSADEWVAGLQGHRHQLAAKLEVPPSLFGVDGLGLLLLPGFELHVDSPWQTLMRQALVASPAVIVVTDQARLASPSQSVILDSLKTHYLEGRQPIVAVTRTEHVDAGSELAAQLRTSAASAFDLNGAAASDRIVLTGDDDECRARWRPQLTQLLLNSHTDVLTARRRQVDQIHDAVRDEGSDIIAVFREALDGWTAENESTDDGYRDQLAHFDEQARKLRSDFDQTVARHLDRRLVRAADLLETRMLAEHHLGPTALGRRLLAWLKIESVKYEQGLRSLLSSVWIDSSEDPSQSYAAITTRGIARVLGHTRSIDESAWAFLSATPDSAFAQGTTGATELARVRGEVAELSHLGEYPLAEISVRAIRLLPVIAFEMMAVSMSSLAAPVLTSDAPADEAEWSAVLQDLTFQREELLTALAGFIGVEIGKDDKPTSIAGLADMLQKVVNPGAAASAAVSGAATVAAAAVSVGVGAALVLQYANGADRDRVAGARAALRATRDVQQTQLLNAFDVGLESLREILAARLGTHFRVDDARDRVWRLEKSLADFRQARLDLLEACRAESVFVG